jgi:hypothetical protein
MILTQDPGSFMRSTNLRIDNDDRVVLTDRVWKSLADLDARFQFAAVTTATWHYLVQTAPKGRSVLELNGNPGFALVLPDNVLILAHTDTDWIYIHVAEIIKDLNWSFSLSSYDL